MPSARFPGDSRYEGILSVGVNGTTIVAWTDVTKHGGTGFRTANPQWQRIRIAGADRDGTWTYNFEGGTPKTLRVSDFSRVVGYGTFLVEAWITMDSDFGQVYLSQWVTITNPASIPGAPANLRLRAGTLKTDSFGVDYSRGSANGAGIEQDQAQWVRVSDGVVVWTDNGPNGYTNPRGLGDGPGPLLGAGVEYRVRVRSRNAIGWGPWSGYFTQRTLAGIHVPKNGAYVPGELQVPKNGAYVPAAAVLVPKNAAYVNAS